MTSTEMIASLDRLLASYGSDVVLRRLVTGGSPVDVTIRASVKGYEPKEIIGAVSQGDTRLILSPTQIVAAGWPAAAAQTDGTDTSVPRKGDKVVISGRLRNIEAAAPVYMAGSLVRIELQVRG